MSRDEILRILTSNAPGLRRLGAVSLSLFGSYARGEERQDSDIDLLVELDEKRFDRYMDLKFFLEELLGNRVDLVLQDALKPRIRPRILAEAVRAPGL